MLKKRLEDAKIGVNNSQEIQLNTEDDKFDQKFSFLEQTEENNTQTNGEVEKELNFEEKLLNKPDIKQENYEFKTKYKDSKVKFEELREK